MPISDQKNIYTQTFTDGVDSDTAPEYLKSSVARYMLNCITMSTASSDVGIVTNVKGNVLIEVNLPAGRCRTLGWTKDEENNKFYYFVWNENGYHSIYMYNGLLNAVTLIIQSITDTGGVDIFKWSENDLILMSDVVRNSLLYWVKNGNDACKINIEKAIDKSETGYGPIITEEFVNAYKLAPSAAPIAAYFSDTSVNVNRWYGTLAKFASRYVYDDGETSNWSDWSNAPVPAKESFTGVNFIPTDNNGIYLTVTTGSRIVVKIEISMQYTLDGGYSSWVSIVSLDKKKLSIGDNSEYVYSFYNDGSYAPIDQEKIIRPYSYLPSKPLLQAFTKNAMIYGNFKEGFPDVPIDMSFDDIIYEDLFLDDSVENELNDPSIIIETIDADYITAGENVTRLDGTIGVLNVFGSAPSRANLFKLTVGVDVKAGNKFNIRFANGFDDYNLSYTATNTDTATSVINKLKQLLFGTGRILRDTPDLPATDPYVNTNSSGNISFQFIMYASPGKQYLGPSWNVNPVNVSTLKDTGQSVPNQKLGAATKYGIVYEDKQGRRSLTYTNVNLILKTDTQNELGGIKKVKIILNINHTPPIWAYKFQIVRTNDLTYGYFIQMIIQKVIEVISTDNDNGEYLDLLVGSLYTYQEIHPNTTLKYEFKKGDRIRFISKDNGDYYDFFETEILEYNDVVETDVNENAVTTGNDVITVENASEDNVGKFIRIDTIEREILEYLTATTYRVNAPIGDTTAKTYLSFTLIDRRGSVRIRKPAVTISDNSLVEIFTPAISSDLSAKQFFFFNKKFDIKDAGLSTRAHFGDIQEQTPSQPAKISITEGTVYVRSREMPITNNKPAQVVISTIEDPQYSDFYFSLINANGKTSVEDNGTGVVDFGSRLRYSNNYIEDTSINGLNDFDNLDREDYNDKYGDGKLLVFTENQLLFFKELKTGIIPVFQTIIQDNLGQDILGTSSKLLNALRYYDFQAGIGNNPESYSADGSSHYFISVNSGKVLRIGGDGVTPISEIYDFNHEMKLVLAEAYRNGAEIFSQWDVDLAALVVSIRDYSNYTYNGNFNSSNWQTLNDYPPIDSPIEILSQPEHGTVTQDGTFAVVESDYIGKDSFTYRIYVNGAWVTKKVCLNYKELPNRQKAWRPRFSDAICETEEDENTGNLIFITLEEYYVDNGQTTGQIKPNTIGEPDYTSPIVDLTTCPFDGEVFENVEITVYATKNDCPIGQVGSSVPYTIPAGSFTSVVDQETADAKAMTAANTGKQANANSLGTCTIIASFGNDLQTKSIQRNNCGGGLIGTYFTATAPANTFFDVTKLAANNQAITALNGSYGQDQANAGGSCVSPSYFTFEIVMYDNYRNSTYKALDSRGVSFEFRNGSGYSNLFASKLVSVDIIRNNVVHTYSIAFPGSSISIGAVKCFLQTAAITVAGTYPSTLKKNGSNIGAPYETVSAGIASGIQYTYDVGTAISTTLFPGDILRLEHGTPSSLPVYSNVAVTVYETRNNCPSGQVGSSVPLTVSAGLFTSTISQADADAQALSYANASKQSNANTYGTCSVVCTLGITTTKTNETSIGANNGTITVTATGGVGTLQFSKNNGSTWITATSPYTFNSLSPATYPIKVKDANNCESTASVIINAAGVTCDLSIAFVSKTNETSSGANNGTITITGSTSYVGGFLLSKDGGVSYLYTGTSPFTFTALAPGTYNIRAKNANNTCETSSIPVIIEAGLAYYMVTDFASNSLDGGTICASTLSPIGPFYSINSDGKFYIGNTVYYQSLSGYFPLTNSYPYYLSYIESGVRIKVGVSELGVVISKNICSTPLPPNDPIYTTGKNPRSSYFVKEWGKTIITLNDSIMFINIYDNSTVTYSISAGRPATIVGFYDNYLYIAYTTGSGSVVVFRKINSSGAIISDVSVADTNLSNGLYLYMPVFLENRSIFIIRTVETKDFYEFDPVGMTLTSKFQMLKTIGGGVFLSYQPGGSGPSIPTYDANFTLVYNKNDGYLYGFFVNVLFNTGGPSFIVARFDTTTYISIDPSGSLSNQVYRLRISGNVPIDGRGFNTRPGFDSNNKVVLGGSAIETDTGMLTLDCATYNASTNSISYPTIQSYPFNTYAYSLSRTVGIIQGDVYIGTFSTKREAQVSSLGGFNITSNCQRRQRDMSFSNSGTTDVDFIETTNRFFIYDYDEIRNVVWYCDTDNQVVYAIEILI